MAVLVRVMWRSITHLSSTFLTLIMLTSCKGWCLERAKLEYFNASLLNPDEAGLFGHVDDAAGYAHGAGNLEFAGLGRREIHGYRLISLDEFDVFV